MYVQLASILVLNVLLANCGKAALGVLAVEVDVWSRLLRVKLERGWVSNMFTCNCYRCSVPLMGLVNFSLSFLLHARATLDDRLQPSGRLKRFGIRCHQKRSTGSVHKAPRRRFLLVAYFILLWKQALKFLRQVQLCQAERACYPATQSNSFIACIWANIRNHGCNKRLTFLLHLCAYSPENNNNDYNNNNHDKNKNNNHWYLYTLCFIVWLARFLSKLLTAIITTTTANRRFPAPFHGGTKIMFFSCYEFRVRRKANVRVEFMPRIHRNPVGLPTLTQYCTSHGMSED